MHNQFYNIKPKHCLKIKSREDIEEYRGILILQGGAVLDHTTIDCRGGVLGEGEGQAYVFIKPLSSLFGMCQELL